MSEPGVNLKWLKNNAIINWGQVSNEQEHHLIIDGTINIKLWFR